MNLIIFPPQHALPLGPNTVTQLWFPLFSLLVARLLQSVVNTKLSLERTEQMASRLHTGLKYYLSNNSKIG